MDDREYPAATVVVSGITYSRNAGVGAWWEHCDWAANGAQLVSRGSLSNALAVIADRDVEIARLNGIIDAERDMQAKLVAEGTRLSTDLAAARAALAGEYERAVTEAAEEFNKEPQEMMSGEDIADYLRFRVARRATEAQGGG